MNRKVFKTCAGLLATAVGLLGAQSALGQTPPTAFPGDWPNLGAFNNRQGQNGDPATYGSGLTDLRWLSPSTIATRNPIELDNTAFLDTSTLPNGPYDNNPYGFVSPFVGTWIGPTEIDKEASTPRVFPIRAGTVVPPTLGDRRDRLPRYYYAFCTPSSHDRTDPTKATDATRLRYFEWNILPPQGPSRTYAVYAYLPGGPMDVSGVGGALTRRFQQRYYVYEIRYGQDLHSDLNPTTGAPDGIPDEKYIDVVDTEAGGGGSNIAQGYIRLGGGGSATQAAFPVTGVDRTKPIVGTNGSFIRVRLYNTVPRNSDGSIAIDGSTNSLSDAAEQTLANTRLVYADSILARPQVGQFIASPTAATVTGAPTNDSRVIAARNEFVNETVNGAFQQTLSGVVTAYEANTALWPLLDLQTPFVKWRYSVVEDAGNSITLDTGSASFSTTFIGATLNPRHIGVDYKIAPAVVAPTVADATAEFAPTLADGDYNVYFYIGGNKVSAPTESYAHSVPYQILEGSVVAATGVIDESGTNGAPTGWVRLGSRRYTHDATNGNVLKVVINNQCTDPADGGRQVFADAVRFVSASDIGISSSPVHATVNIKRSDNSIVATKVVIVADESGRIHCLDLDGNPDGTTTEYWSYPSTPNYADANWKDPNLSEVVSGTSGIDGTINASINPARDNAPSANMPTSFDLSTAVVANVGGTDLLYIGATNGRVYCIEMTGRGDYNAATRVIGSTKRSWTYPDDYDPTNPTAPIADSALGAFRGSVVFGDTAQGAPGPTIFVPARQGRIIALDANPGNAQRRTTVRWQLPKADQPPLPTISMTPTLFKPLASTTGTLLFGTLRDLDDDGPGRFYAANAANGQVIWRVNGPALNPTDPPQGDTTTTLRRDMPLVGSFIAGPVAVSGAVLDNNVSSARPDTIFAVNDDLSLYAMQIVDGQLIYSTASNDLNTLCETNLTFTTADVYGRNAIIRTQFPLIVIPGTNGEITMAFSRIEDINEADGYRADDRTVRGGDVRSVAAANTVLYAGDNEGALYAYDKVGSTGGNINTGVDTGSTKGVPPNDPAGKPFRRLRLRLVNRTTYNQLRQVDANGKGPLTYAQAVGGAAAAGPISTAANPYAFEWGEQVYVLVYGFPYATQNQASPPVPVAPPQVNVTLSLEGRVTPPKTVEARQFADGPSGPPAVIDNPTAIDYRQDGYGVVGFTFQSAGSSALPPGNGRITASLTTAAPTDSANPVPVTVSPYLRDPLTYIDFRMANPLRLEIVNSPSVPTVFGYGTPDSAVNAQNDANAVNGSPDLGGTSDIESQLLASAGFGNHGGTARAKFFVSDRSLMVLQNQSGLNNVHLTRTNLKRQGGTAGLYNPLSATLYPGFEDQPTNFPNTSLDYPDIGREQVRAVKDPNGNPENPLLLSSGVTLRPPLSAKTGTAGQLLTEEDLFDSTGGIRNQRQVVETEFNLVIDIPRYQPPVFTDGMKAGAGTTDDPNNLLLLRHNSIGVVDPVHTPQGYFGRVQVFVDSTGDGKLTTENSREVYRAFNYSLAVLPQVSIQTGTPSVDLGSLAGGTGYSTRNPYDDKVNGGPESFNPWYGAWADVYKAISVRNDGNVNLLNLRLAKGTNETAVGGSYSPGNNQIWTIPSDDTDPLAWLSAILRGPGGAPAPGDLWSNIDSTFSAVNGNSGGGSAVILPKPRITDRVPTELVANPYPRANPNTGANGQPYDKDGSGNIISGKIYTINRELNGPKALKYSPSAPKVGMSVPIGFPVGNYASQLRVVENSIVSNDILELDNRGVYEAYSDPITLTFKVRETRMTNRATPHTAPVLDDPSLLPNLRADSAYPQIGSDPFKGKAAYRNAGPAAMRTATGALNVVWETDRDDVVSKILPDAVNPSRLYFGTLTSNATFGSGGTSATAGNSPLWDLSMFAPSSNSQWFSKSASGYPDDATAKDMFGGGTIVPRTARFGSPSLPARGSYNPLVQGSAPSSVLPDAPLLAFVGDAQVSTGTGRLTESQVFVTRLTAAGAPSGLPVATQSDPQTAKGKPSVLQLNSGALVFYSETSAGQSSITVDRLKPSGAFATPVSLGFGDGFSSVFSPSANARLYRPGQTDQAPIVELSFAGKLRGRPNAEVYMGRLRLGAPTTTDPNDPSYGATDPSALHLVDGQGRTIEYARAGSPFVYLPQQTAERLVDDGNGVYRARGVAWNRQATPVLQQYLNGIAQPALPNTLLVPNTIKIERQSGLISADCILGGKVYIDPELGTVKFVGAMPNRNAEIRLTYTPTFLRVTPGGAAAYNSVNGMFDNRFVSTYDYWFKGTTNKVNSFGDVGPGDLARNDRYFFAYGRGAAGGGITARPYSTSLRIGIRLPTRVATDEQGRIVGMRVLGATRPYQVDPANGRVYFQAEDEGRLVRITYTGVDEATRQNIAGIQVPTNANTTVSPSFVLERPEALLPVDEAANESSLTAFLDPFTFPSSASNSVERPPLVWLFYVSTRAGGPDLYFQTIAPRFQPYAK